MTEDRRKGLETQIEHLKARIHDLFGEDDQRVELLTVQLVEQLMDCLCPAPSDQAESPEAEEPSEAEDGT